MRLASTFSLLRSPLPGLANSTVVPSASPAARPSSAPRLPATHDKRLFTIGQSSTSQAAFAQVRLEAVV